MVCLVLGTQCMLHNQPTDETFDYRVRAVTEAGEGPPSKATQVTIKDPEGQFRSNLVLFNTLDIHVLIF